MDKSGSVKHQLEKIPQNILTPFWKISAFKINEKPVYSYFVHDGISLWWAFKEDIIKFQQYSPVSALFKEEYKNLFDRYLRKKRNFSKTADFLFLNTTFIRTNQDYFGSIKRTLGEQKKDSLSVSVFYPRIGMILPAISGSLESEDAPSIYAYGNKKTDSVRDKTASTSSSIYKELSGVDFDNFLSENFEEGQTNLLKRFLKECCYYL